MFVCDPGGLFYSGSQIVGRFHHSSFLAGGRVLAAGEWVVSDGRLLLMTNKTGHYRATTQNLANALRILSRKIDITAAKVMAFDQQGGDQYFHATEIMANNGVRARCARLPDHPITAIRYAGTEEEEVEHDPDTWKQKAIKTCSMGTGW